MVAITTNEDLVVKPESVKQLTPLLPSLPASQWVMLIQMIILNLLAQSSIPSKNFNASLNIWIEQSEE